MSDKETISADHQPQQTSLLSEGIKQNPSYPFNVILPPRSDGLSLPRTRMLTESPVDIADFGISSSIPYNSLQRQSLTNIQVPRWVQDKQIVGSLSQSLQPPTMTIPTFSQSIGIANSLPSSSLPNATQYLSSSPRPSAKRMARALDQVLSSSPGRQPLDTAAGSITYDLYKYSNNLQEQTPGRLHVRRNSAPLTQPSPKPSKPVTLASPNIITTRGFDPDEESISPPSPDLSVQQLLAPGGFRRHYVTEEAKKQQKPLPPLTRNFVEFLTIYSNLHGLDEDDEDDPDYPEDELFYRIDEAGNRVLRRFRSGHFPSEWDVFHDEGDDGYVIFPARISRPVSLVPSEAKETDALLEKDVPSGTSVNKTYLLLLKSFVGTGILFIPSAFVDVGVIFGVLGLAFMAIICTHCMLLLFSASRAIPMPSPGYGDVAEVLMGPVMRTIVQVSVALSQCGFSISYLIFASQNIQSVIYSFLPHEKSLEDAVPLARVMALLTAFLIPMVWIRSLKKFSIITLIADLFILIAIIYLSVRDVQSIIVRGPAWKNGDGFTVGLGQSPATFLGTALFAFEGSAMVLPVSNAMEDPRKFPKTLILSIVTILIAMMLVGVLNYCAFGNKVETIIFLSMPPGDPLVRWIQILYALAVFMSYPICIFPAIRIIESWIFGLRHGKYQPGIKWAKNFFRSILVALLGVIGYFGSSRLDLFVSLLGSVLIIPMGYIYPSLFSLRLGMLNENSSKLVIVKNLALVVFGLFSSVFITIQNIRQWING